MYVNFMFGSRNAFENINHRDPYRILFLFWLFSLFLFFTLAGLEQVMRTCSVSKILFRADAIGTHRDTCMGSRFLRHSEVL